jgi:23S rRNA (adenine-N6)-dimethyltransferase
VPVPAHSRTRWGARRRSLGQNFLRPERARELVTGLDVRAGELVVEIGAGAGALTAELSRRGAEVIAVELDPRWAAALRARFRGAATQIRVVERDFLAFELPRRPFRAVGSLPFGATTQILRRLFDDPASPLMRADLVVQSAVARKRAEIPPQTLLSTAWAPWWEFALGPRLPAQAFQPIPRVDAALLSVRRRTPALLPPALARDYAAFLRARWPLPRGPGV